MPPINTLSFLLLDNFSMIAFSNLIEPFRIANYLKNEHIYRWRVGGTGLQTRASNGIAIAHTGGGSRLLHNTDILIVCGGYDIKAALPAGIKQIIRTAAQHKTILGGACTGALALAQMGLLEGYTASVHWENLTSAREKYPNIHFSQNLFIADRDRFTCSGGTASLDMALYLIAQQHGKELARKIADLFMIERIRPADTRQHTPQGLTAGLVQKHLSDAIRCMENHLSSPQSIAAIADRIHLSERQLQRLFQEHLRTTPQQHYTALRLSHAAELLRQTDMSIAAISLACGFTAPSNFAKAFRKTHSISPSQYRKTASEAFAQVIKFPQDDS